MHKMSVQVFYNPKDAKLWHTTICIILMTINATIGDKSNMPTGGIIFLKTPKNISVNSCKPLNG